MRFRESLSIRFCLLGLATLGALHAKAGPHDAFMGGPWEVMVRIGLEGDILHFPLAVEDESQTQVLSQVLPVRGTAVVLTFTQFVPDLVWTTACVPHPAGGCVAKLRLTGASLDQQLWLSTGDVGKRSISAPIGGVAIREVQCSTTFEALMRPQTVGVLTLGGPDSNDVQEIPAQLDHPFTLADGLSTLTVLRYEPHYVMDRQTKAVSSSSEEPVNPAVLVRLQREGHLYEEWVWERFVAPPHEARAFPLQVRFANTLLGPAPNKYLLAVVREGDAYLYTRAENRLSGVPAVLHRPYPFGQSGYAFTLQEIVHGVTIQNTWSNNSNRLVRPALVGTIQAGEARKQVVLEFNKPYHYKTEEGTLVLVYRRAPVKKT
jgi:hypothetical protein